MKEKYEPVTFVMPTFNEKECIESSIKKLIITLKKYNIPYQILVVDDGSKDGTIQIVKNLASKNKNIKIIVRNKKAGFGFSLIDGSKQAKNKIIVWVMGDASDNFETIPLMLDKIAKGEDMVIGSRNMAGGSRGDQNKLKAIGSKFYSFLAKILFNLPVYDITNAFRAFRKKIIMNIDLENGNFAVSPEFAIKAHLAGFKIAEVPTTYNERKNGEAKTKLFKMGCYYYYLLFKYRLTLR